MSALSHLREVCSVGVAGTRRLVDPRPLTLHFFGTLYLGLTLGDLGHISEALATLHSGLEMARSDGYSYWVPRLLNAVGGLYRARSEHSTPPCSTLKMRRQKRRTRISTSGSNLD
jgi:hypothetical protein